MTNFNFKFLGAWLVIVASITGLQAQNDFTLKGKDEMVPAGVWNDVNGSILMHTVVVYCYLTVNIIGSVNTVRQRILYGSGSNLLLFYRFM